MPVHAYKATSALPQLEMRMKTHMYEGKSLLPITENIGFVMPFPYEKLL
jgi:hypothetical protein